jgi:hypothetical protein
MPSGRRRLSRCPDRLRASLQGIGAPRRLCGLLARQVPATCPIRFVLVSASRRSSGANNQHLSPHRRSDPIPMPSRPPSPCHREARHAQGTQEPPWCTMLGTVARLCACSKTIGAIGAAASSQLMRSCTWPQLSRRPGTGAGWWLDLGAMPQPRRRAISAGQTAYVPCYGCGRLMCALTPDFRRSTCSPACAMRVLRRRLPPPPPFRECAKCQRRFIPGRRGTDVRYCSRKCQLPNRARPEPRPCVGRAGHQVASNAGDPVTSH